MPKASRPKKDPPPPRPWQRAEAGRYRSSDDRFTLGSEGSGRWFVTDAEELDELGLERTSGPYATLDEAKAAADAARGRVPEASPLAGWLKEAASRPAGKGKPRAAQARASADEAVSEPSPEPEPPRRTWLDDLEDRDKAAARTARRMIDALEREGIDDADSLVRRDILGNEPIVATRLLARDVLAAIGQLDEPSSTELAAAVADVLASSKRRANLPGWRLVERDGPSGADRGLRITPDDLRDAATKD